jgi:diguanylate cyclase (GGDEF)-like protein/PAS domain S-box-containing protein
MDLITIALNRILVSGKAVNDQQGNRLETWPDVRAIIGSPGTSYPERWLVGLGARFIVLVASFSVGIFFLVGLSYLGFQALSGARAYVQGESQWAKAQKQAVIALHRYAASAHHDHFMAYLSAREVILGDRRARTALEQSPSDRAAAREGFRVGRNDPDDIELMIRLFEWLREEALFEQAVGTWAAADGLIDELDRQAQRLQQGIESGGLDRAALRPILAEIEAIDIELTAMEQQFSGLMGQLSHRVAGLVTSLLLAASLLLILAGTALAMGLFRSARASESALRESEERYRALVDQSEVGMWQLDADGKVTYLNPAMQSLLDVNVRQSFDNVLIESFVVPEQRERMLASRHERAATGQPSTAEYDVISGGVRRQVLVHGAPVILGNGTLHGHVGTCLDITDRKASEEQLRHQALHDSLTGLPNRQLFIDRLTMALRRGQRENRAIAVMFIDLDGFKKINDRVGHIEGDQLLREAAQRLRRAIRQGDTIARFGGDEFVVILENSGSEEDIERTARRVLDALGEQSSYPGKEADESGSIRASIGIAISEPDRSEPDALLREADLAMYEAKRAGGHSWFLQPTGHRQP